MRNEKDTAFRPNRRIPVYKYDLQNNLVYTYPTSAEACKEEGLTYSHLTEVLASGISWKGHVLSRDGNLSACDQKGFQGQFPWEGNNGMFDVRGWASVCF